MKKLFIPVTLLMFLVWLSLAECHPVIGASVEQVDERSTVLDMEPSESKVKKFYKKTAGYGYGGYALPLAHRFYPSVGATVLVGYPLLTGYGYGGYGGVIPYLGYGYGR